MSRKIVVPDWSGPILQDLTSDTFFIRGGLGSGKTTVATIKHLDLCFRNNEAPMSWCVAPTYTKVKDILIPSFRKVLYKFFGLTEGIDFKIKESMPQEIKFTLFDHVIGFRSADKPQYFVGSNLSHFMITEAFMVPDKVIERCFFRTRDKTAEVVQAILEGCPENHVGYFAENGNFEGYDKRLNARSVRVSAYRNQDNLSPGYIEKRLIRNARGDKSKIAVYVHGHIVPLNKGSAFWDFSYSENTDAGLVKDPYLDINLCFDFNIHPLAWVVFQKKYFDIGRGEFFRFEVNGESTGQSRGLAQALAEFRVYYPPDKYRNTTIRIHGDCNGYGGNVLTTDSPYGFIVSTLKKYYSKVVLEAPHSNPGVKERLEMHNALLKYGMVVIDSRCNNTVNAHVNSNLKPGKFDFERVKAANVEVDKPSGETWTHFAEALSYGLFHVTKGLDLDNLGNLPRHGAII